MKIVSVLVILVVVQQCYTVDIKFSLIHEASEKLFQSLEARNRDLALTSAERLYKEISEYKETLSGLDHRKLEEYGYKSFDCYKELQRLENVSKSFLTDIKAGKKDHTSYDQRSFNDLLVKAYKKCSKASNSFEKLLNKNEKRKDCEEESIRYGEKLQKIYEKNPSNPNKKERDAAAMALYIACGDRKRK
eukprot:TRINITY_DN2670_c0_g1_i1.p1 TRINITY_DN2670_c0_g1~~TRINITY_DN2670_c0_g1_i1.p1  ORF type:complete len:190 (+),score=34.47 TRINITY_DN2670_c0_g1_i1:98-667(+)